MRNLMEFLRLSYYFFVAVLIFSFEFSFLFDVRVLRLFERFLHFPSPLFP